MTDQTPAAGRITIDDVRNALVNINPNDTNANKVRLLMGGRGSFETIQKHLSTLRQELALAAAPPIAADQVPALPTDAAAAMWTAAWTAAQVQTLRRTEKLAAERDAALLKLETMSQDVDGLIATVDDQAGQLEQAVAVKTESDTKHSFDLELAKLDYAELEAKCAKVADELGQSRQALAIAKTDAVHAAQIAESGRDLIREELARMTDQISELKAALYKRAESAVTAPVTPDPSPAG